MEQLFMEQLCFYDNYYHNKYSFVYQLLGIPLASSSKSLQINALYKAKSSGDVSVITWSLATYGCGGKLLS